MSKALVLEAKFPLEEALIEKSKHDALKKSYE